ncbi:MAG: hypothetical protein RL215_812, partial [Planctomycetota bacterium]
ADFLSDLWVTRYVDVLAAGEVPASCQNYNHAAGNRLNSDQNRQNLPRHIATLTRSAADSSCLSRDFMPERHNFPIIRRRIQRIWPKQRSWTFPGICPL